MINDLDATIKKLVDQDIDALRNDPKFANSALVNMGAITCEFQQPKSGWNNTAQSGLVLNFFLYDVRENAQLRRHQWESMSNGHPSFAQQKRLPLRIDCFYLVTAWHDQPEWQHWLLASCLQVLGRYSVMPEQYLQGALKDQPFEIRTKIAAHDVMTNPAEIWSALGNDLHVGFSYVVTIAIDPWQPIQIPLVTTRVTRVEQLKAEDLKKNKNKK